MKKNILKELNPCESGYKFAKSKKSLIEAWNTCERGDWMLWFASKLECPLRLLILAKGKSAETVIHLMQDDRSRQAVEVAIDFGNGVASHKKLDAAADAAKDAAADAFAADYAAYYAANCTADDAAYAAYSAAAAAADAAACDAYYAADYAADYAAAADAAFAAREANQQQTANICREILTDFIKSKL